MTARGNTELKQELPFGGAHHMSGKVKQNCLPTHVVKIQNAEVTRKKKTKLRNRSIYSSTIKRQITQFKKGTKHLNKQEGKKMTSKHMKNV